VGRPVKEFDVIWAKEKVREGETLEWILRVGGISYETFKKRCQKSDDYNEIRQLLKEYKPLRGTMKGKEVREPFQMTNENIGISELKDYWIGAGLPIKMLQTVMKHKEVMEKAPEIQSGKNTKELIEEIDRQVTLALHYMTPLKHANMTARESADFVEKMVRTRNLLAGLPTQIVSREERMKLNELVPALLAEAERRGLKFDEKPIEGKFSAVS